MSHEIKKVLGQMWTGAVALGPDAAVAIGPEEAVVEKATATAEKPTAALAPEEAAASYYSQRQLVADILDCLGRSGMPTISAAMVDRLHREKGYDKERVHQATVKLLRDGILFVARCDEDGNEFLWRAR